jgi:hypothetical protein
VTCSTLLALPLINGSLINGSLINGSLINGSLINGSLINGGTQNLIDKQSYDSPVRVPFEVPKPSVSIPNC